MNFYRYVTYSGNDDVRIVLQVYNLFKETPKGYWIGFGSQDKDKLSSHPVWVSKTSKKRFAYPTKEEAINNLIKRTDRRLSILRSQESICCKIIDLANQTKKYLIKQQDE